MAKTASLPEGFEDLAPFVADWGELETAEARHLQRQALPMDRLTAFYRAVQPRLGAVFEHLNRFPHGAPTPEPEARLFRLVMGMSEAAQAVEIYGQPTVPNAPAGQRVTVRVLDRA